MFKSMSIKTKLLIIVISSITIVSVSILVESIVALKSTSEEVIKQFEKDAYKTKENELKNYISLANKTIESYYKRTAKDKVQKEVEEKLKKETNFIFTILEGTYKKYNTKMSEKKLKKLLKDIVQTTRYANNGYFWINDTKAKMIIHPIKPSLNGEDLSKLKDKAGKKLFFEFAKLAKTKGEGFVDYLWDKPGFDKAQKKISFVKLFKPYNWVIGTGTYLDDVSKELKEEALHAVTNMKFGKSGYFWINNSKHIILSHGAKASLAGKDMTNLQDKKGKYIYKEIVKISNNNKEGGILDYYWPKPNEEVTSKKIAYVKKFIPWDFIIGTGAYVDDIENKIALMKEDTNKKITASIIKNIVIILIIMLILSVIMVIISNKVIFKPLMSFQDGLLNFFKYINKENKDIKPLDDSSNDEIGVMARIINQNVIKTKSLLEQDEALINDVKRVVESVKKGKLSYKVEKSTKNEALQELKIIFNEMLENIEANVDSDINKITKVLDDFTNLDFTNKIDNPTGNVSHGLNKLAKIINKLLLDNLKNGSTLEDNASTLSSNVSNLSASSNAQAASLEETAAALEEITSTIINTTNNITNMATYSNELKQSIQEGQKLANSTVQSMNEINSQTQAIAEAITVIDQIAFQTNILSLNAAVEAATAGEAGKGFAVVAQEVRNLANRSAEAAKEIKDLVEAATNKTNLGKKSADLMINGYKILNENINKTTETINDIASSSKEQQAGIEQINDAITTLDQGTQKNAAVASQTAIIADSTSKMAKAIVDEANEANFIGKGSTKNIAQEKTNIEPEVSFKKANLSSRENKSKNNLESKIITASNNSDDNWKSF